MKNIFRLSLVLIVALAAGCTTNTNLKYHEARSPLIPTNAVEKEVICKKLRESGISCKDPITSEKVDAFVGFIKSSLPPAYFDSKSNIASEPPELKARVEVTALPSQRGGAKTPPILFSTLTREGQQAIIQHLATRSKSFDDDVKGLAALLATLRNEVAQPTSPDSFDPVRQTSLTVSASLNSSSPADRLERVYTFILIVGGATVEDSEDLQTDTPKFELGTLKTNEQISGSLGISGIPILQTGGTANVGLSPTFSQTLERVIRKEFARRNIAINADQDMLFIRQDGIEGVDLSGNVSTKLTLRFAESPAAITLLSGLKFDSKGNVQAEKLVQQEHGFQNVGDIKGIVVWVVQVRSVRDGGDTILEEDDVVVPQIFLDYSPITLWRNRKILYLLPRPYINSKGVCMGALLKYQEGRVLPSKPRLLAFGNHTDAINFMNAVIKKHIPNSTKSIELAKDFNVGFGTELTLNEEGIKKLFVYRTEPKDFPLSEEITLTSEDCNN